MVRPGSKKAVKSRSSVRTPWTWVDLASGLDAHLGVTEPVLGKLIHTRSIFFLILAATSAALPLFDRHSLVSPLCRNIIVYVR
jgi:hypothetical protein